MKIAYWAMFHGQAKTTTNMLLVHSYIALTADVKQLILSNQFSYNLIEEYLGIEKDKNTSLDNLLIALRNKTIKQDYFNDYTESILKNHALDLVTESIHSRDTIPKNIEELFVGVMEIANKVYKHVLVDVSAGMNDFNKVILDASDMIIVNLNQNKFLIDATLKEIKRLNVETKVKYILGDYNDKAKYTKTNIERQYKIKIDGYIPYNKNIINALNLGETVSFVNQNVDARKQDENYRLMEQINQIAKIFK